MASIIASLPPPLLAQNRRNTLLTALPKLPVCSFKERQNRVAVVVRATSKSSESSTSLSIVKSVQNAWDNSEDRIALVGLGFAAVVAFWASANLITAIDKLPLLPSVLEFVGILYSSWFIYRYLLFKPDREELFKIANKSISNILGQ
ncbi:putative cyanobacterial aminoacyl-tRNA synthetase, CAAD domain, protein CURVATURE THYLAKOID 1 [Rosa chinensis]|uniref:Putative cyanobacterial aminoacyl-tRNA synthetase, CAAD domain, protein CURVATURE THYLAKOID 1 n=1 Tax=Rosa chinensis TaxID=74649 RepID=A0A2P6PC31_ROSCH|nr:protein CURVATURE THYLAKOID 1C, chloroplastic isoform X1 [Rosa chinensis]PRQ19475.1 putative cyanobacterial aminoacyl-tRNA synthetase, CAAD domain, protein CURVATURE THYLAKOID 1 [Rosa chinensis]